MRHRTFWSAAVGLALLVGAGALRADEDEQDIALEDLPKAVVEAVKARFPGAELAEAEKETENGRTLYEVELKHNAQEIEVSVTPQGTIVEIEKEDTQVGQPGDGAGDTETIYRLDPVLDELLPVPQDEQKAGHIYLHYSQRLGRRVWSFRLANGRFWHAFGEGTVQPARLFDLRRTLEESLELLGPGQTSLRDELRRTGGTAMMRLGENGRWTPAHVGSAPTIYDSQTRRLWQLGASDYIPVSHSPFGYSWTRSAGQFVPAYGVERAPSHPAFSSECGP